jgi:hypothetical protein
MQGLRKGEGSTEKCEQRASSKEQICGRAIVHRYQLNQVEKLWKIQVLAFGGR